MKKEQQTEDKNIGRRKFLKKIASTAVFVVPTIQTFSLLQAQSWQVWTGHGHGHHQPTPPPPPPPPDSWSPG